MKTAYQIAREHLHLSERRMALMLGTSVDRVKAVEDGKANYDIKSLHALADIMSLLPWDKWIEVIEKIKE